MSSPSSAIDVATRTFISPDLNFSIIAFCSLCFSPVVFPLPWSLIACPTKLSAFIPGSSFSVSDIFLTVSRNCAKTIILEFGSFWNCFWTIFFRAWSFGCSCSRVVVREYAFVNLGSAVNLWTPFDFFSAACWNRSFRYVVKEEIVWVSRSSIACEIFIAWAHADTAIMLFMFLLPLMLCISLAWVFRSIVFDA